MTLVLGNRRNHTVAKYAQIALLAMAITLIGLFGFNSNAAAASAKPATCDAAIAEMNKSLVLVAKRRIQARTAKKRDARKLKRAKRNLKKAQARANAARVSIRSLCAGSNGVSALDAQCTLSIDSLAKSIDLKYTRTLRYKKLKVKGKTKKARKLAAKRKRAMKTQLKRLDDQIKAQTQSFNKACGGIGDTTGDTGGTGGGGGVNEDVDITPPGAVIIDGPEGPTNDTTPTVEVTAPETGGHTECRIDGGAWFTVTSPWTLPALSEGTHTITCRYVDGAGNTGEETSITITIDTTAPGAVYIDGPNGPTSDTTPAFNLSGAGAGEHYECRVDGGDWTQTGALFVTETLSSGTHTITCRLVDEAGNIGPESTTSVTIDTEAPGSVTIDGPGGPTNDTTPALELSGGEGGGHYECRVDGGAWQTVPASWTLPELSEGEHTVDCRYVDAAGNAGAESSIVITIDTTPPGPVSVSGPSDATTDTTPSFVVTGGGSDVAGYECKTDGGSYAGVTGVYTTSVLSDGTHTVVCRAADVAGNVGPDTTTSVTVDTIGPAITVTDGAPRWDGTHSFTLGSSEGGTTYKCKIDGGSYATVGASFTTGVLSNGSHTVTCYGVDALGNTGATVTKAFGVFKDPMTVSKNGGFQWGLGCTLSNFLNAVLGCPDSGLSIAIPANPNGLSGNYLVDISGQIKRLTAGLAIGSSYTMNIVVDGVSVAYDKETVGFDFFGACGADLSASKNSLSLSATSAHTIQLTLKTSALISVFPSVQSSSLSVSIHH